MKNPSSRDKDRPFSVRIISCRNIIIKEITFQNSAKWMQHYLNCDYLQIEGIEVFNHVNRNNDGLDIGGCRNVVVSNCIIDIEDVALCLKSSGPNTCEYFTISNCILRSNCNAFILGTESIGGFKNTKNVFFRECIRGSDAKH
ncbi:MAG: glycosyl hydrolase family 28 protein [Bacteroidales bacterium]